MDYLQSMVQNAGSTDALKEQALEAIGYICQDIVSNIYYYFPGRNPIQDPTGSWILQVHVGL